MLNKCFKKEGKSILYNRCYGLLGTELCPPQISYVEAPDVTVFGDKVIKAK